MTCVDVVRHIDPYIDRELDPAADAAVGEHLSTCAACRRKVSEREALGRLVRSTPYFTAPDSVRAQVAARRARTWPVARIATWAAAAVLVLAVGVGVGRLRHGPSGGDVLVQAVVDGHVRSLMAEHLFDVQSTDQHTVKPWFLGRLDFSPPVTDLASIGFPLIGGRLDYIAGRPVAALVYRRQKHTINVFVAPVSGEANADPASQSVHGFHVRHWVRGEMSFYAVSDLNDAELNEFARALQTS